MYKHDQHSRAPVLVQFSHDPEADLAAQVAAVRPEVLVTDAGVREHPADTMLSPGRRGDYSRRRRRLAATQTGVTTT